MTTELTETRIQARRAEIAAEMAMRLTGRIFTGLAQPRFLRNMDSLPRPVTVATAIDGEDKRCGVHATGRVMLTDALLTDAEVYDADDSLILWQAAEVADSTREKRGSYWPGLWAPPATEPGPAGSAPHGKPTVYCRECMLNLPGEHRPYNKQQR